VRRARYDARMVRTRTLAAALLVAFATAPAHAATPLGARDSARVVVFRDATLHWNPDSVAKYARRGQRAEDHGRVLVTTVAVPRAQGPHRVWADVTVTPIAKSEREPMDRYDRAGNVRLALPGRPDVELVRFMTAYGGRTDWSVDVSALAPLLGDRAAVKVFVDTWARPGWRVDVALRVAPDTTWDAPSWAAPVCYTDAYRDTMAALEAWVDVPPGTRRTVLRYLATGHCSDGRDEDEFVSKPNVIAVDGRVVARVHPWRSDCRRFRDANPYCARWTDGSWSSDYSRSGWCPGDVVTPIEFDLTDALTPGRHRVTVRVEGVRPRGADGEFGFWRLSAAVIGWDHAPRLWRNPQ